MTLSASETYLQSYKQHLQYQTSVTAIENRPNLNNHDNNTNNDISSNVLNLPILYNNEDDLPMIDKVKKSLMQSILGAFTKEGGLAELFPNDSIQMSKEHYVEENPYSESLTKSPFGFMYESSSEYYEKTTFEFNAQATIKTPQGEYQIEISFSYTQEFYEKHETEIHYAQSNFEKPFEINLDEDDGSFKGIDRLSLMFDILKEDNEEEKNLFDEIKKLLYQRHLMMLRPLDDEDNKPGMHLANMMNKDFDNFKVFEKSENQQMSLIAMQKDGVGVFLSNSQSSSSYVSVTAGANGVSVQSGYSSQQTTTVGMFTDIKV